MRVSIVFTENGFENVFPMELPGEESLYDEFLKTILAVSGMPADQQYEVAINGKLWTKAEIVKAGGTLKALCLKEDDMLVFTQQATASSSLAPAKLELAGSSTANLLRSIVVAKSPQQAEFEKHVQSEATKLFARFGDALKNAQIKERLQHAMPGLIEVFEKDRKDFGAFLITYRNLMIDQLAGSSLTGNSVEMQKKLEQKFRNDRLDQNKADAYHETPEAFVQVHMLYIKVFLNGVECNAFVDTGAQVSLISPECAARCNLESFINSEDAIEIRGVGGVQKSPGIIWRCDMTVTGHEFPVTLRVLRGPHDVLFGLDLMLRHRAIIDLGTRTLTFNGVATTNFLSDAEASALAQSERETRPQYGNAEGEITIEGQANDEAMDTDADVAAAIEASIKDQHNNSAGQQ